VDDYQNLGCQEVLRPGTEPRLQHEPDGRATVGLSRQGLDIRRGIFLPGVGLLGHGGCLIVDLHVQVSVLFTLTKA